MISFNDFVMLIEIFIIALIIFKLILAVEEVADYSLMASTTVTGCASMATTWTLRAC